MTDVPADVMAAIEALFNAARQGEELAVVGGLHAVLVAAIAKALKAARAEGERKWAEYGPLPYCPKCGACNYRNDAKCQKCDHSFVEDDADGDPHA